jgi:hypothetical protein
MPSYLHKGMASYRRKEAPACHGGALGYLSHGALPAGTIPACERPTRASPWATTVGTEALCEAVEENGKGRRWFYCKCLSKPGTQPMKRRRSTSPTQAPGKPARTTSGTRLARKNAQVGTSGMPLWRYTGIALCRQSLAVSP